MTTFANLASDFDRLFPAIPKPDPLCGGSAERWCLRCFHEVDADETNHGPCAQGDCDE
jgi:hypothetical protein